MHARRPPKRCRIGLCRVGRSDVSPGFAVYGHANPPTPVTHYSLYRRDKLSRLAPPCGLIERRPSCGIRDLAERGYPAPILPRRLAYDLTYLVRAPVIRFDPAPLFSLRSTQKPVGKEKTRKKAIGFAGGGAGRRDSGVRRVDVYLGTYETVGGIEKPGSSPGFFCFSG